MAAKANSLPGLLLGRSERQRTRVSQSLLGIPALLLMQALLVLEWRWQLVRGDLVAWYVGITLAGCAVFYGLVRGGLSERLSSEASLSAPQMVYAMACVAWGYLLAGPYRAAMLCLMPLILCFGIFALKPRAARALARFGMAFMGFAMFWRALNDPAPDAAAREAAHWVFVAVSMAMISVLSERLGRMRSRLSTQKAELSAALERIQLLATRDPLTGLLNRRAAQDELRRAMSQADRGGRPLTVALADLDHFKLINDSFGHLAGDRVLHRFARLAEAELRGADRVARWGGEEFLFVLPDTDELQACACLDRLRTAFTLSEVEGLQPNYRLTFSAGVAQCDSTADIEAAIERADRAMYSAKVAGRDRVACTQVEPAVAI